MNMHVPEKGERELSPYRKEEGKEGWREKRAERDYSLTVIGACQLGNHKCGGGGGHSVVSDRWHQTTTYYYFMLSQPTTTTRQLLAMATSLRQLLDYYLLLFHTIPTTYNNYNY